MGDNDLLTLFHQSNQFEEMTFCLLYGNDFRGHGFHHSWRMTHLAADGDHDS